MTTLITLLTILGGLGLFLFGMRIMSEGIRRGSGASTRKWFKSIARSTRRGAWVGAMFTAVIQSSSATTVMVVGLVNARMLTVRESVGLVLGANIGTTITAWLVVWSMGSVSFVELALPLIGMALPLFLLEGRKARELSHVIIGFGLLFIGLGVMRDEFEALHTTDVIAGWEWARATGLLSSLLFLAVGAVFAGLIQSSSAAIVFTMTAVISGMLSLENGVAMILGENLGTTLTANLAATVGSRDAKRTARIHFLFNGIGSLVVIGWVPICVGVLRSLFAGTAPDVQPALVLASFHSLFNLSTALVLSLFTDALVRWSEWLVRPLDDASKAADMPLEPAMLAPLPGELGLDRIQSELQRLGRKVSVVHGLARQLIRPLEDVERQEVVDQIKIWEDKLDASQREIDRALQRLTETDVDAGISRRIQRCSHAGTDLERMGDIYASLAAKLDGRSGTDIYFIPAQRSQVLEMFDLLQAAIALMIQSLDVEEVVTLGAVKSAEKGINAKRDALRAQHLQAVGRGDYSPESGLLYHEVISALEEIGDLVASVGKQFSVDTP